MTKSTSHLRSANAWFVPKHLKTDRQHYPRRQSDSRRDTGQAPHGSWTNPRPAARKPSHPHRASNSTRARRNEQAKQSPPRRYRRSNADRRRSSQRLRRNEVGDFLEGEVGQRAARRTFYASDRRRPLPSERSRSQGTIDDAWHRPSKPCVVTSTGPEIALQDAPAVSLPRTNDVRGRFGSAAHLTTTPHPAPRPQPKKRRGGSSDGRSRVGLAIVEDYVKLCRDPAQDLMRWLQETDNLPGVARFTRPTTMGETHEQTSLWQSRSQLENTGRLCSDSLHGLRDGLDPHRQRRSDYSMLARSTARTSGHDTLRPLQTHEGRNLSFRDPPKIAQVSTPHSDGCGSALGAIDGDFAARRAAILASARPSDIRALLRALADEQTVARRNALDRSRSTAPTAHVSQRPGSLSLGSGTSS